MVQLCGDAHLSNFGVYATPERQQTFDINDFDETYPGPFEWDVKRLAASVAVVGLVGGFPRKKARAAALAAAAAYRTEIRRLAPMGNLAVWYSHQDMGDLLKQIRKQAGRATEQQFGANLAKARFRDSTDALRKLCVTVDGQVQIKNDPPLIMPGEELLQAWGLPVQAWYDQIGTMIAAYRRTLQSDRRQLLDQFRFVQLGFKVVGVGSVGTRAWIALMDGADAADPLFLQAKEAQRSVLADYVRQLRDGKGSIVVERMNPAGLAFYAQLCGRTLARAHARSGDREAIAGYLGGSTTFDEAVADFSMHYAARNDRDHTALRQAVTDGRVSAREGV